MCNGIESMKWRDGELKGLTGVAFTASSGEPPRIMQKREDAS